MPGTAWSAKRRSPVTAQGILAPASSSPAPSRIIQWLLQGRLRLQWRARGGFSPHFPCRRDWLPLYGDICRRYV